LIATFRVMAYRGRTRYKGDLAADHTEIP